MSAGRRSFAASWKAGDPAVLQLFGQTADAPSSADLAALPRTPSNILGVLAAEPANQRPAAQKALQVLADGGVAVVTGQQAGLLLGPLYTFHKALSAVRVADALRTSGRPAAAVFWVQDEDHDFEEMTDLAWIDGSGELRRRTFEDLAPRVPVGDREVPDHVRAGVREVLASLEGTPHFSDAEDLARPWLEEAGWSDAFCGNLAAAFAEVPILVLRGREPEVARATQDLYVATLRDLGGIEAALVAGTRGVEALGFRPQIPLQPGRTLSFLQDARGAPRHRLVSCGPGLLRTPAGPESAGEIAKRFAVAPECFTTSALLRPLVQDRVLPVAVQLVGPGEAAYLAQLGPLRTHLGVARTAIAPRGAATWVEPWVRRRLDALEATASDCAEAPSQWLARTARLRPDLAPSAIEAQLWAPFSEALASLSLEDAGVERARQRTLRSVRRNVDRFIGQAARFRARADAVRARRYAEVRSRLYPFDQPQERLLGLTDLVARHGRAALVDRFLNAYVPFSPEALELSP